MDKAKQEEFWDLVKPLMIWLKANYHPHVKVIVEPTIAELVEGLCSTGEM